ncbi:MAG: hypothetical protein M1821_004832 [Bathelium mastoideum]|nr:MAG: hypothetical protein M1821_004832 [Bathelium mastoideum]
MQGTRGYQGKYSEAEAMNRRALAGSEKELGLNHPGTLTSVNNLAYILKDKDEDEKATALMEECAKKRKQILGQDHPFTKESEDTFKKWYMEAINSGSSDGRGNSPRSEKQSRSKMMKQLFQKFSKMRIDTSNKSAWRSEAETREGRENVCKAVELVEFTVLVG